MIGGLFGFFGFGVRRFGGVVLVLMSSGVSSVALSGAGEDGGCSPRSSCVSRRVAAGRSGGGFLIASSCCSCWARMRCSIFPLVPSVGDAAGVVLKAVTFSARSMRLKAWKGGKFMKSSVSGKVVSLNW